MLMASGDTQKILLLGRGIRGLTFVVLVALFLPAGLWAHSGARGVVMDRMMVMMSHDAARADIENMLFGDADYDAERIQTYAKAIADQSGDALTKLFPEDSLYEPSIALPAVWQDWDTFSVLAQVLKQRAETLEAAAVQHASHSSEDLQRQAQEEQIVEQAFEALAETCDSCHLKFREQ